MTTVNNWQNIGCWDGWLHLNICCTCPAPHIQISNLNSLKTPFPATADVLVDYTACLTEIDPTCTRMAQSCWQWEQLTVPITPMTLPCYQNTTTHFDTSNLYPPSHCYLYMNNESCLPSDILSSLAQTAEQWTLLRIMLAYWKSHKPTLTWVSKCAPCLIPTQWIQYCSHTTPHNNSSHTAIYPSPCPWLWPHLHDNHWPIVLCWTDNLHTPWPPNATSVLS